VQYGFTIEGNPFGALPWGDDDDKEIRNNDNNNHHNNKVMVMTAAAKEEVFNHLIEGAAR